MVFSSGKARAEAADLIMTSMQKSIASKKVAYDFARLMEGATQVSCSGFGDVADAVKPTMPPEVINSAWPRYRMGN